MAPVEVEQDAANEAAIEQGAELVLIEGLGDNLPPGVWEPIAARIATNVRRGEARRGGVF